MADDVIFFTQAKKLNKQYKSQAYTITYLPQTKEWKWEVKWVRTTVFSDTEKTMNKAQKAAEKHIDSTLKNRGQ
jgi:hypothetical protein